MIQNLLSLDPVDFALFSIKLRFHGLGMGCRCSTPSQMTTPAFKLSMFGTICGWHCVAFKPDRSRVMKKQRGETQAEKVFDAKVAQFNQEAQKILDDRSLSMGARRRLISLKGKALLRPAASSSQPATR
jgi:hypothetical protein